MAAYKSYSDVKLTELLKSGDQTALTEIYRRYQPVLFSHAFRRFPDREQVRDIIQDLFLYLWNNREKLEIRSTLAAYLYSSVRNKILNHFRNQKVQEAFTSSLSEFINTGVNITDDILREKELIALMEKEVSLLPSQMRLIFIMSREDNLTHKEIADQLGISPHTVRTQVRNALRILRIKFGSNIFFILF